MVLALHRTVAFPSLVYRPRRPEQEGLHTIVRDHYQTFRAQAAGRRDGLCRAVVAVYMRAVLGWLRQQASTRGVRDSRGGAVVIVQRFGSALNLNVHLHAMVMDGVFTRDTHGAVRFHIARYPVTPDMTPLLVTLARPR